MDRSIRLKYAARTDVGRERTGNEDGILALSFASTTDSRSVSCGFFVVSDGMGGHNAGEIASMTAVKSVMNTINREFFQKLSDVDFFRLPSHVYNYHFRREVNIRRMPKAPTVLRRAVRRANGDIIDLSRKNPAFFGMGATITAAVITGRSLVVANVGDSRCYLAGKGSISQLTHDHTIVSQLLHLGKITAEEAEIHPAKNFLYKSLGSEERVEPDLVERELEAPSTVVLCSDGLSNMVSNEGILEAVQRNKDPHKAVDTLVRLANQAGGKDNISVIVVQVT